MKKLILPLMCTIFAFVLVACEQNEEVGISSGENLTKEQIQANYEQDIKNYHGLEHVFLPNSDIKKSNKPSLIIFGKNDCKYCEQLKEEIKSSQILQDELKNSFNTYYVNLSYQKPHTLGEESLNTGNLARKYSVRPTPTLIFVDTDFNELYAYPGYVREEQFNIILGYLKTLDLSQKHDKSKIAQDINALI